MGAANLLAGDDVYSFTGTDYAGSGDYAAGVGDGMGEPMLAAVSGDPGDATSAKVALLLVLAVAFVVALRANGFRDMIAA